MEQIIFVQLSDLHVGQVIDDHGAGLISGQNSHDVDLATGLAAALRTVRIKTGLSLDDPLYLCVTGDLTASGHAAEFAPAHSLLHSHWVLDGRGTRRAGLEHPVPLAFVIAGNHDQWMGRRYPLVPAYSPVNMKRFARQSPWLVPLESEDKTLRVEVMALDSNAGLAGRYSIPAVGRALSSAAGSVRQDGRYCDDHVRELRRLLQARDALALAADSRRVRVLLTHHCITGKHESDSRVRWRNPRAGQLDDWSWLELDDLACQFGIDVLLTGHMHDFYIDHHHCRSGGRHQTVHEVRCATTLQAPAEDNWQGFYAHQIEWDPQRGYVQWNLWQFRWKQGRFWTTDNPYRSIGL